VSDIEINQTVNSGDYPSEEIDISAFEGKTINITETTGGVSDVQAGIEFIYHMREHLVDVGVATVYLLGVYALFLWITKKLK